MGVFGESFFELFPLQENNINKAVAEISVKISVLQFFICYSIFIIHLLMPKISQR